jgi:hypothetical protein
MPFGWSIFPAATSGSGTIQEEIGDPAFLFEAAVSACSCPGGGRGKRVAWKTPRRIRLQDRQQALTTCSIGAGARLCLSRRCFELGSKASIGFHCIPSRAFAVSALQKLNGLPASRGNT